MSLNQSRNDSQYRKPGGRSGNHTNTNTNTAGAHHRPLSGGGRGRGASAPTPPTNRSYKKVNNNNGGQGGLQSRPTTTVNVDPPPPPPPPPSASLSATAPPLPARPPPLDKSTPPLPRPPSANANAPSIPTNNKGGTAPAKGFALQFGSLTPGFMNGMQVPARTSSAPPNLHEQQKRQELSKKDAALVEKPVSQKTKEEPQVSRDVQVAPASQPTHAQKTSAPPKTGIPMPSPFHQPTASMQFRGPNPQNQSQGVSTSSLQMPMQMPLHMGNPSQVAQQVFVPGLQHPLMQTHGIMHQGQNMGYNPQLATKAPHQLGNIGINMSPQYNQSPIGKFTPTRKTVKITHPDTHEELRLDGGPSGSMSQHSALPQNQLLPAYTANPMGYYPNTFTNGPPVYPVTSSLPVANLQSNATSQGSRFNYPVSQTHSNISYINQPSSVFPVKSGVSKHGNVDPSTTDHSRDVQNMIPPAKHSSTTVTIKAPAVKATSSVGTVEPPKLLNPNLESGTRKKEVEVSLQSKSGVGHSNQFAPEPGSVPAISPATLSTSPRDLESAPTCVDGINNVTDTRSLSIGHTQSQSSNKKNFLSSQQVDGESDSNLLKDVDEPSKTATLETSEAKLVHTSSGDGVSEAISQLPIVSDVLRSDAPSVIISTNSSHLSDSCESQNVVKTASEPDRPPLSEDITRELSVSQDKGEEESTRVLSPDNLNASNAVREADQDHQVKHIEKTEVVGGETEASHKEVDSVTSDNEGENMQCKLSYDCDIPVSDTSSGLLNSHGVKDSDVSKPSMSDNEAIHVSENFLEANAGQETEIVENPRPSSSSGSTTGSNKASLESSKTKNKGKKKLKEAILKADARGTTADLYVAYKGPEEKKETLVASELAAEDSVKDFSADLNSEECKQNTKDAQSKVELDDWEDADLSSPKLEFSDKGVHDEGGATAKKYSRDFLLKFCEHCTDLPKGFAIVADVVADAMVRVSVSTPRSDREYPSSGRAVDRQGGIPRLDRRGIGTMESDRWNKQPNHFPPAQDPRLDLAYGSNVLGFEGVRGPYGVLRNPRPQGPGGILSGPLHSSVFHHNVPRNNVEPERWARGANYAKGLMPSPHTPVPMMHKAERKYEVGKITDEEQAKQRKLKGILNKLTPQNFERLFEQVKEVNIDNVRTLNGVISQIFDKALTEPTFCEMYANFCQHLASELPDLSVDDEKITFRRLLLNKCQEEFERGEREEQEANNVDSKGDTQQSEEVREEMRVKARRRMLGNIRLIGELYKKRMLTERIMHECIKKLLGQYQNPDEENIEALCKLMSTIGEMIDHPKAKEHMDAYFDIMRQLSNNMKLSSRVRFMLRDAIDLRKDKWQQRRKVEGPKKIEEVHRDAAQERQGQASRLNRGPSMNSATRRGQPPEFSPRGSMLPSSIGPGMGFRGMPPQARGFGGQDMRIDERSSFETRTLSMPLPQRLSSDEPITLGPQGGLARGMAFRGQPSASSSPIFDNSPSFGDPRRMAGSLNGYGAPPDRGVYSTREDHLTRNAPDRFGASVPYDQSNSHELTSTYMNREVRYPDRNLDRSRPTAPPVPRAGASAPQNSHSDTFHSEERLRDMSLATIKEYYSAKDVKEVELCIKELNAPSFYPTVVSMWVSDSFERKNIEQDLLAKLLVSLTKTRDGTFSPTQLMEGFESVLTNLEDTVTDAPKAPEFLGRILAKIVLENVLPLKDLGRLIQHGGDEPGRLVEVGLAAQVLGSLLEMIKSDKGEITLHEIQASCNLHLEDFRPPLPIRCHKLEMFL